MLPGVNHGFIGRDSAGAAVKWMADRFRKASAQQLSVNPMEYLPPNRGNFKTTHYVQRVHAFWAKA